MPKRSWNWRPQSFLSKGHRVGYTLSFASLLCTALPAIIAPAPVFAAPPVQGLITRPINAAPTGADAVRVSIFGDKSGAKVQVRLLEPGEDGILTGAYAAAPVTVDFEGWKTVTMPLSDFTFVSSTNPEAAQNGVGTKEALAQSVAVQIAVMGVNSRIFIAGLGWASSSAAPTDPLLAAMDAFTDPLPWKIGGDYEQIRAVKLGVATKDEKPSLIINLKSPILNDQAQKAAIDSRLKARPTLPYFLFSRLPFETISAESVPTLEEVKAGAAVSLTACPDEIEPASLAVYTTKDLKNATVKLATPLMTATKGTLPAGAVDVRVVRIGGGIAAPQLLMKDDRQSLSGPNPTVRLTGDPQTDIPAGTAKQFWVTVKVSKNQRPGTYKGSLVFSAAGVKPTTIPITLEVVNLPDAEKKSEFLPLKTAFLQYGMDFRSLISAAPNVPGGQIVSTDIFAAHLADIRDHGFKNVMLYDKPDGLQTALQLYKSAEMNALGPVVLPSITDASEVTAAEGLRTTTGYRREQLNIYYVLPLASPLSFVEATREVNRNARFVSPVESSTSFQALSTAIDDPMGERLAPLYPVSADYSQSLLKSGKRPLQVRNVDYWSWNIPLQSPIRNRILAGFLLYSTGKSGSGVYGAFAGPYQYLPEGVDPYAAFSADADPFADPKTMPLMVSYPVAGGVLNTIQWEAVREGVDDVRYIGILKGYIRDLKDLKIRKDATEAAETYLLNLASKPLLSQTPEQIQANRRGILREALKLAAIIRPPKR